MRTVLIISVVTFVLIFGGIVVLSGVIPRALAPTTPAPAPAGDPADLAAAERAFTDLAAERDRVQRERESLVSLRTSLAAEEKMLADQEARLRALVDSLGAAGSGLDAAREQAAAKLAKMYEAMKPDKAAPILAALDMETILEVLQRMKERPAARILASMDAALAARISERLSRQGVS